MRTFLSLLALVFSLPLLAAPLIAPFVGQWEVARRDHFLIVSNLANSISSTGGITLTAATNVAVSVANSTLINSNLHWIKSTNGYGKFLTLQNGATNQIDGGGSSGKFITVNKAGSSSGEFTNRHELNGELMAAFWQTLGSSSGFRMGYDVWNPDDELMDPVWSYTNLTADATFRFWKRVRIYDGLIAPSANIFTLTNNNLYVDSMEVTGSINQDTGTGTTSLGLTTVTSLGITGLASNALLWLGPAFQVNTVKLSGISFDPATGTLTGGSGDGIAKLNGVGTNTTIHALTGGTIDSFRVRNTNDTVNHFVVATNGRVGINTNTPQASLHVNGNSLFIGQATFDGGTAQITMGAGKRIDFNGVVNIYENTGVVYFEDYTGAKWITLNTENNSILLAGSAAGTLITNQGSVRVTDDLVVEETFQQSWIWLGRNTNIVIDAASTNNIVVAPTNSATASFANAPAAGSSWQRIQLKVLWTNMPSGATFTHPAEVIFLGGTAPPLVLGETNFFTYEFWGTNWFGFASQSASTGTGGTNVNNVSPTIFTPTITSPTINGQTLTFPLVQQVTTNYAHATSLAVNAGTDVAAFVTNTTSANTSLLITNTTPGTSGTFTTTSDGSARTFNIFSDKLITMISTNETLNSTQIVTTASKKLKICWSVDQLTATSTGLTVWAKSQP